MLHLSLFINFALMSKLYDTQVDQLESIDVAVETQEPFHLIVWNDEVNTFEWVIETLIEVCKHSMEQAEQSAYIIHFKGKYSVKDGDYDQLKPMCNAITERGIGATIETMVS
jgi:ATP-dependent Clp protease adaptor protein ClpS